MPMHPPEPASRVTYHLDVQVLYLRIIEILERVYHFYKRRAPLYLLICFLIGLSTPFFSQYPSVEWKLDGIDTLVYQYEQESYTPVTGLSLKKGSNTILVLRGDLNVIPQDSAGLYIEISSVELEFFAQDSLGKRTSERKMNVSNRVLPMRNNHGKVIGEAKDEKDIMFNLIFPMPDKDLGFWDTTAIPMSFPFNGVGQSTTIHGFHRVYCTKNIPFEAALRSEIDIVDYDIPFPNDISMFCYLLGDGEYVFDTQKGYYKSGKLDLEMAFGSYDSDEKRSMIKSMEMITEMKFDLKRVVKG